MAKTRIMGGTRSNRNPERWQFTLNNAPQSRFYCFPKLSKSWNPVAAWKVPSLNTFKIILRLFDTQVIKTLVKTCLAVFGTSQQATKRSQYLHWQAERGGGEGEGERERPEARGRGRERGGRDRDRDRGREGGRVRRKENRWQPRLLQKNGTKGTRHLRRIHA